MKKKHPVLKVTLIILSIAIVIIIISIIIAGAALKLIISFISDLGSVSSVSDEDALNRLQKRYNEEFEIESSEVQNNTTKKFIVHPVSDETKQFETILQKGSMIWVSDNYWSLLESNQELISKNNDAVIEYFSSLDDPIESVDIVYDTTMNGSYTMSLVDIQEGTDVYIKYDTTQYDLEDTYLKFYELYKNHPRRNTKNAEEYGVFSTFYVIMTYDDKTALFRDFEFNIHIDTPDEDDIDITNISESTLELIRETDNYKNFINYTNWEEYTE